MKEMDKETTVDSGWVPEKTFAQNALDHLLPDKIDTHNLVLNEEDYRIHPLTQQEPEKMMNSQKKENNNLDADATERSSSRGQIDVIEMPTEKPCSYKYFFVYEDQLSKFVVLKALHNNTAKEVALKLLDILAIIGAPQVLQSGNGRGFAQQVVQELRGLWKDFVILHGDISKFEEESRDFKSLLKCWLKKNPTKTWYEGLKFVQIFQNSTFRCQNGKIPCDILFGRNVHEDFQRFTTGKDMVGAVWAEEEWTDEMLTKNNSEKSEIPDIKPNNDWISEDTGHSDKIQENNFPDYESDSYSEFKEDSIKDVGVREESVNGFNFVNVKSEILSNNLQSDNILFDDENVSETKLKPGTDNLELKCDFCEKQYTKPGHLRNHMKTHIKSRKFECTLCNKTFHVLSLYEKHMRQSHGHDRSFSLTDSKRIGKAKRIKTETTLSNDTSENPEKDSAKTPSDNKLNLIEDPATLTVSHRCIKSTKVLSHVSKRKIPRETRISKVNADPTLECTYCKQKFNFPSVLKRHMRSHTNERPYVCEICNKSFKQLGHLTQHSLTHKDYRSFQCTACGVKFESLDSLKVHSQTHKGESMVRPKEIYRLFECDNCKKVFTTKSVLERHIFTHTHERQFGCKICGKRFKQAGHVKSHMLVHTGERRFECTVCSKRFSLSNSLKKHMYVHNGEKPYQCDVCGARFLERRNLNGHLMTHTNERPFSCKICGKRYTLADTLRRHISAAHEDGRTYQCEICAKMFKQLAHLSVHKKVHNDERPFQCHLCDKNFKHKNVLKSHLAIHANVRPFECDVCKATFVRKTNLQTHIASAHMNERPYACTICGKRFKQISHLNGHVVVHSNSMPYQCDFCDRRCNRLDNLKKHMRLHTKNKE